MEELPGDGQVKSGLIVPSVMVARDNQIWNSFSHDSNCTPVCRVIKAKAANLPLAANTFLPLEGHERACSEGACEATCCQRSP